jgi:hypothetical protein
MRARGWRIGAGPGNHIEILDADRIPYLVGQLSMHDYPVVVAVEKDQVVRSFKSGCTTPLDAWTISWLATGIDQRPKPMPTEPVAVQTTWHYPLRGNHWSIDGDWNPTLAVLISHLRGPNHAHQTARYGQLESWSYEELRSLHDNLHEQEMRITVAKSSPRRTNTSTGKASGGY